MKLPLTVNPPPCTCKLLRNAAALFPSSFVLTVSVGIVALILAVIVLLNTDCVVIIDVLTDVLACNTLVTVVPVIVALAVLTVLLA